MEKKNNCYILKVHSFIDVITNSSSELFISSNKKALEFFKEIFKSELIQNGHSVPSNSIRLVTFEQHYDNHELKYMQDEDPEYFNDKYGSYKKDDEILEVHFEYGDHEILIKILEHFNFEKVW